MKEISLRFYMEALLLNKRIVLGITAISIIISIVLNFIVLQPVYEAKTILMTSNLYNAQQKAEGSGKGIEALLDTMSQYPQMTVETYKEQINNPYILQQTIDELKLDQYSITRVELSAMLSLDIIPDTNLIVLAVRHTDKKMAQNIANTIARKFTEFLSEKAKEQANKSSNYVKLQMDTEKEYLDKVLLEYRTYLSQPRGLNELEKEVNSKLELITKYKTDLINANIEENKISASIAAAERQLTKTSEKITLRRSILDEPYMSELIKESTDKNSKGIFSTSIQAEEVNDAYIELKNTVNMLNVDYAKTVSEKRNLQKEINNLQKELESLQADLAVRQHQDIIIQEKVKFAQDTYNAFMSKYEEIRITKTSDIGEASIIVLSPSVEPLQPIAPNKKLNIIVSAVIGVMIGIFVALFKEYWKSSGFSKLSM